VKQYQNFDKNINGNTNKNFSIGKLRWILSIEFVFTIFIGKHQQKYFIGLYQEDCSGKKKEKKIQKNTMACGQSSEPPKYNFDLTIRNKINL
jgi:hypothetical protein